MNAFLKGIALWKFRSPTPTPSPGIKRAHRKDGMHPDMAKAHLSMEPCLKESQGKRTRAIGGTHQIQPKIKESLRKTMGSAIGCPS